MSNPITDRVPAVHLMRKLGKEPDPWQLEVLEGGYSRLLLNCCRQAGKSTVVAMLALSEALWVRGTKVLLVSRSARQSRELFNIVSDFYRRLNKPMAERQTLEELWLSNQSRIFCVPCRDDTIRGYSNIRLLVIDEAARVPDIICRTVAPMLAVSNGRMICLSTPYGKRGFFHDYWSTGGDDWARIEVPAERISRIRPEFLARERRTLGESWYRQEYECSFEAMEGLVYPDFDRCVVAGPAPANGGLVGGIDFGFRNPFAAVWGTIDRDGILWLTGEHYLREKPLAYHARHLPRQATWYADPSGAAERYELRAAGHKVRQGENKIAIGIAAVTARLANGTLRVLEGSCPNLLAEAGRYRYDDDPADRGTENPLADNNHALDALRYLVCGLDRRHMARATPPAAAPKSLPPPPSPPVKPMSAQRRYLWNNPDCWTTFR
jgi:hypothetical protein